MDIGMSMRNLRLFSIGYGDIHIRLVLDPVPIPAIVHIPTIFSSSFKWL